MAAEDFTGPAVLKAQSNAGFSGSCPGATPVRAGWPRNMGQSAAQPVELDTQPNSSQRHAAFVIVTFTRQI